MIVLIKKKRKRIIKTKVKVKPKMKKTITLVLAIVLTATINGQSKKLKEYTASNGITYKIGDTITLANGSNFDGKFQYVQMGGLARTANAEANKLPGINSGLKVNIKKIRHTKNKRFDMVWFVVGGGNIANYWLFIEDAIDSCEIDNCNEKVQKVEVVDASDKYDKLAKIKKLLDDGVLTKEEYETEKKKILNQ